MDITFRLGWVKKQKSRNFKSQEYESLFNDYTGRIAKFCNCDSKPASTLEALKNAAGHKLWICHTGVGAKQLSSVELSDQLKSLLNSSVRKLEIVIGGSDGFLDAEIRTAGADLLWNFGKATYPHELAAVIASEQIYRALTILNRLPYHEGH